MSFILSLNGFVEYFVFKLNNEFAIKGLIKWNKKEQEWSNIS